MRRRRYAITKREMLVVILVVCVLVAMLMPSILRARERANRIKCHNNLRAIGQALLLYSNDNRDHFPRTTHDPATASTPTWGTGATASDPFGPGGPAPNDVSAAIFLLLRTQDITPEVFLCPSTALRPWDFGGDKRTALNWSNWSDYRSQLGYSYHNPYPDGQMLERSRWFMRYLGDSGYEFAVMADISPGVVTGTPNLLTITTSSSAPDLRHGNSPNHRSEGQNVLYGDGHVNFETNPFVGSWRDNIYTARTVATPRYASNGVLIAPPYDLMDSILLPTAR